VNNTFYQSDSLPEDWSFMEFYVPINGVGFDETKWVHSKITRDESDTSINKKVEIETDYFENVFIKPWTEDLSGVQSSAESEGFSFE
jgi:hypothetical protein